MYKDKERQREAQREWVRQKRAAKGSTKQGSTITKADSHVDASDVGAVKALHQGMTVKNERSNEPSSVIPNIPALNALCDKADAMMGKPKGATLTDEEKAARFNALIADKPKRGKDIKTFADLPPDIQQTIDTLSDDQAEHKRRTAIAINYQHLFPDRYHSTGCDVFKRRQGKTGVI